jgi:hypothetical protein
MSDQDDIQGLVADAANIVIAAATQAVIQAVGEGVADLAKAVEATTNTVRRKRVTNKDKLRAQLEIVAKRAQAATLNSYAQLVTRHEGAASKTHYRAGHNRYADGVLREALASEDFYTVNDRGLSWGNTAALNDAARQWHRVAFGAQGRGRGGKVTAEAKFEDIISVALGYEEAPSPGFNLPPGLWITPDGERVSADAARRGEDIFRPLRFSHPTDESRSAARARSAGRPVNLRPNGPRRSKGIEGADFFAAGVRTLAQELPQAVDAYIAEVFGDWEKALTSRSRSKISRIVRTKEPNVFISVDAIARKR